MKQAPNGLMVKMSEQFVLTFFGQGWSQKPFMVCRLQTGVPASWQFCIGALFPHGRYKLAPDYFHVFCISFLQMKHTQQCTERNHTFSVNCDTFGND